jgi:hypothetical protein
MSAPELHVISEDVSTTKRSAGIHSTTAIRGMRTIEPVASWYKNLLPLVHILATINVPTADTTWLNGGVHTSGSFRALRSAYRPAVDATAHLLST